MEQVPVVALTGRLGAGKTTLLNHVLRSSDARIGVVVNDFGAIDVDAALLFGQVDEPAAISGGCLCCLEDDSELDVALERLSSPALALDAIVVEASGMADPVTLARMIRFSGVDRVRPGGLVEVVDGAACGDRTPATQARYRAATLVVVNKLDRAADQGAALVEVTGQARAVKPGLAVVGATGGAIDPALLVDAAEREQEELPWRELLRPDGEHRHEHADAVTVAWGGEVDPGQLVDLLESPPADAYRLKGTVAVRWRSGLRVYAVNVVGGAVHVARAREGTRATGLVAIGMHLDEPVVRARLQAALTPAAGAARAVDVKRLDRLVRLSL